MKNKLKVTNNKNKLIAGKKEIIFNFSYLHNKYGFDTLKNNNGFKKMDNFIQNRIKGIVNIEQLEFTNTFIKNKALIKYVKEHFGNSKLQHLEISKGGRLHVVRYEDTIHLLFIDMNHKIQDMS